MSGSEREFGHEDVAELGDEDGMECPSSDASVGMGEDYALVIGVNHYPKLRPLQGAIADARAFTEWLLDVNGGSVRTQNVFAVFSSSNPLAPIGPEINDVLEKILEQAQVTGGRRFYFYFSGHGCVGDKASDLALCMANWSTLRRRAALSSDAWLDVIVRSGLFDEVAFFLDCCRVGATRAVGLPPDIDFVGPIRRSRGTRVFLAYATEFLRSAREVSSMDNQREVRGIFTKVLLDGLRGAAMDYPSGVVTAYSLKYFIEKGTRELASARGYHQRAEVVDGLDEWARFGEAHDTTFGPVRTSYSSICEALSSNPVTDAPRGPSYEVWLPVDHPRYVYRRPLWGSPTQALKQGEALLSIVFIGSIGLEWSLRRGDEYIKFNGIPQTNKLVEEWNQCLERLRPGAYYLCCSDAGGREVAIHLYPGFTTQVVIEYAHGALFESIRVYLRSGDDAQPPDYHLANAVERGLARLGTLLGEMPLSLEYLDSDAFDSPMEGLLAAHLNARGNSPDADRINAIANRLESLIGPCADVEALRLRAALIRGDEIQRKTFTEPPMLREGLLAFIEASHQVPEIIAPGSLLEYACIERQMDSPFSSWPARPSPDAPDSEWLAATIDEIVAERELQNAPIDARTIAKELGVPTLAVEAKLPKSKNVDIPIVEPSRKSAWRKTAHFGSVDEPEIHSDPEAISPLQTGDLLLGIREHYEAGDHRTALRLAETFLRKHPAHLAALGYAESSRQMLRQKYLARIGDMAVVPRIKHVAIELARLGVEANDLRIFDAIDGVRRVEDIVHVSGMSTLDVLRVIHDLAVDGLVEFVTAKQSTNRGS